jgi:hypothetical protein
MDRHHRQVWGRPSGRRAATTLRAIGFALISLAAVPCLLTMPGSVGIVAWLGFLTAAALLLILLFPYAPRVAAGLAVFAPAVTVLAGIAGR